KITGKYPNTSFEEVNRAIYSNPEIMQQHMHGLVFAQFLWPDQYHRFQFFCDSFPKYAAGIRRYLEIGGGHALYVSKAAQLLPATASIDVIDISPTSLEMARTIAGDQRIRFKEGNVFDLDESKRFDFITMGEVLEHVEAPHDLLAKLRRLLEPDGRL